MQGKIIKGIAGFYYVHVETSGIYECKAKGIFRNKKIKPLVGDNVLIDVISEEEMTGNITEILPRKNELIRPSSANIDQALVIFAIKTPEPNFNLLDRFILMMDYQSVPTVIAFNKTDLAGEEEIEKLKHIYEGCGCKVIFVSTYNNEGVDEIRNVLKGKTTILAGPSGVGKSSLTNLILPNDVSETGGVSRIGRGRHTTRHSEIFNVCESTYICDTPGFTSLILPELEKEDLRFYFEEFTPFEGTCRFNGCVHINEPDCKVKEAVESGTISIRRYQSYTEIYEELKNQKKY
ncbi:MAG: ribosome small subunit-dependent GTPase A [Eubacteriales bacterium]|nr:ribosome small subunit-dependent GTPase A [Eubacteriales bacterium]